MPCRTAIAALAAALSTGCASVHASAHDGDTAAVSAYLNGGGSISARSDEGGCLGCTPLHAAVVGERVEVARLLLDRGADANALAGHQRTPLHYAVLAQSAGVVRLLLQRGARPSLTARDEWGSTPLALAAGTVRAADTWAFTPYGAVATADQAGEPSLAVVEALLDGGAEIDAPTSKGNTPLHIAAYKGHLEVVRLLLAKGARPDVRNAEGETPVVLAERFKRPAVVRALRAARPADP